mmetsp:Transcript_15305/g.49753  ORF Transcript_15305/g.49753 Transcript_15305/m.49753 type:complete len:605 (+) Transcript_15305:61-1875(+)
MGNALMSRVRPAPEPEPAPVEEVLDPVRKLTMAGRNPRLSFYSKAKEKTEKLDDGRYGEMSWFDFLVHTELCTMNYDALLHGDTEKLAEMTRVFMNLRFLQTLRLKTETLAAFLGDVWRMMPPKNFYHNFSHICDVSQCMYTLLVATRLVGRFDPLVVCAAICAAICHDLEHPGLSNVFQNSEKTALSLRYDGKSPLENHHCACFDLLVTKHGLLDKLNAADGAKFTALVKRMILTTDMANHNQLMSAVRERLEGGQNLLADAEGTALVLSLVLKCSDISNQVRPWTVANRWNAVVYEEFYAEGDLDRAKGRAVAPLQDRTSNDVNKSSVGFIRFIVKPLFQIYADIMKRCADLDDRSMVDSRAVEECLYILDDNMQRYENALNGMDNENTEAQFETLDALADQVGDGGAAARRQAHAEALRVAAQRLRVRAADLLDLDLRVRRAGREDDGLVVDELLLRGHDEELRVLLLLEDRHLLVVHRRELLAGRHARVGLARDLFRAALRGLLELRALGRADEDVVAGHERRRLAAAREVVVVDPRGERALRGAAGLDQLEPLLRRLDGALGRAKQVAVLVLERRVPVLAHLVDARSQATSSSTTTCSM